MSIFKNMQEEKFSLFVPIEIIEKGNEEKDADGLPKRLLIGGVASNSNTGFDKDGQLLKVDGFDYQPLLKSGYLNLEHGYSKTKDASLIVGLPTNAFIKDGEFHVEGELFRDNPKAVAMYKLGQTLKKAGSSRTIGYSVEGHPTAFDPLDKRIIKSARITGLALTISPKCSGTHLFIKGGEIEHEVQEGSEYLVDIVDDNGVRVVVDKELNIFKGEEIEKAGEGSRGGKVIGHTKSGKAIYEVKTSQGNIDLRWDRNSDKHKDKFSKLTKEDHRNLSNAHREAGQHTENGSLPGYHSASHHYHSEMADDSISKAMQAGSVTGRETTDQAMTGEPLKQESLDGVPKKKKKKELPVEMNKAELFTYLIGEHSMDVNSCKNFWMLTAQIQKSLNGGYVL